MNTDFRALCADIVFASDAVSHSRYSFDAAAAEGDFKAAIDNARTALAQHEPVGPTDEEILKLAAKELCYKFDESWFLAGRNCPDLDTNPRELLNFARAVLARWAHPPTLSTRRTTSDELFI
jgi:hypothetical protein